MKLLVLPLLLAAFRAKVEDTRESDQRSTDDTLDPTTRHQVADKNIWERHPELSVYQHNIARRDANLNPDSILSLDKALAPAKKVVAPNKGPASKKTPAAKNGPVQGV
ncbi:unnamed protein product [Clonostachys rhizophaga]|uniref:Uncharacterized protein n=1 Tax=Clonostachys rhizophaga TaxID=160324 RepID=A0A9N9VKC2_9HYPO|nr:unnamed protein product [Clonostachys rhizophaga]